MRPTLHILSNPFGYVHFQNRMDPFSIATWKFIHYMTKLGWRCIHYSTPGSEVDCESVLCLPELYHNKDQCYHEYNLNSAVEIGRRKKPNDMILCFYGSSGRPAADSHPELKVVEPSIGYPTASIFAPYRIFCSYAHMHMYYGEKQMLLEPSWYDEVIPNAITSTEFTYSDRKEDYFLCFGRIIPSKGIHLAIQATEHLGKKLVIAGPGNLETAGLSSIPSHVEFVGMADIELRRKLMSKAKAILGLTYYVEPFGNMVAEGYMSGTPAITTDWGGFIDTVVPGVTGYRIKNFRDLIYALNNIENIQPINCYRFAMKNYEDMVVHSRFNDYFTRLAEGNFYKL